VTNIVSGDIFDARIHTANLGVAQTIVRVSLVNVTSPEISTPKGLLAKDFAEVILLNKIIWFDIDDLAKDEKGPYEYNCVRFSKQCSILVSINRIFSKQTLSPSLEMGSVKCALLALRPRQFAEHLVNLLAFR